VYGLTNDLVNAALAEYEREARRVALEKSAMSARSTDSMRLRRLISALGGALTAARSSEPRQPRPVTVS
jgi:hypothetical protein